MDVLIVDDESPARERLGQMLGHMDGFRVAGEARNGREALELAQTLNPDIVLMDIRMPGIDGIEAARHMAEMESGPAVIFTTAYDEYAIQAFDAQAIGYLLKPVRRERLGKALHHAAKIAKSQLKSLAVEIGQGGPRSNICVRTGSALKLIPVDEIFCFQADHKYVTAKHLNGEHLLDDSLKALADEFSDRFIRIHRSALIAVAYLDRLEKDETGQHQIWLRNSTKPLPVSRRHVTEVKTCLKHRR